MSISQRHLSINGSNERRRCCHRCGNIRKQTVECTRCPQIFCDKCAEKMKDEYGHQGFIHGCPSCKGLCCCADKRFDCPRKIHCYKKCPLAKLNIKQQERKSLIDQEHGDSEEDILSTGELYHHSATITSHTLGNKDLPVPDMLQTLINYVEMEYPNLEDEIERALPTQTKKRRRTLLSEENINEELNPLSWKRYCSLPSTTTAPKTNPWGNILTNVLGDFQKRMKEAEEVGLSYLQWCQGLDTTWVSGPSVDVRGHNCTAERGNTLPSLTDFSENRKYPLFAILPDTTTKSFQLKQQTQSLFSSSPPPTFDPTLSLMSPLLIDTTTQHHTLTSSTKSNDRNLVEDILSVPIPGLFSSPAMRHNTHNMNSLFSSPQSDLIPFQTLLRNPPLLTPNHTNRQHTASSQSISQILLSPGVDTQVRTQHQISPNSTMTMSKDSHNESAFEENRVDLTGMQKRDFQASFFTYPPHSPRLSSSSSSAPTSMMMSLQNQSSQPQPYRPLPRVSSRSSSWEDIFAVSSQIMPDPITPTTSALNMHSAKQHPLTSSLHPISSCVSDDASHQTREPVNTLPMSLFPAYGTPPSPHSFTMRMNV